DSVVDGAVVLVGVAASDVVVVGVFVAPDHAEALIDLARHGPRTHRERHVLVGALLDHREGEPVVGAVRALLNEHVIVRRALSGANSPFPFGALAGPGELEARWWLARLVGVEIPCLRGRPRCALRKRQRADAEQGGTDDVCQLHFHALFLLKYSWRLLNTALPSTSRFSSSGCAIAIPAIRRSTPKASSRPNFSSLRSMSWTISAICFSAGSVKPNFCSSTSNVHRSPSWVNSASNMSNRSSPRSGR